MLPWIILTAAMLTAVLIIERREDQRLLWVAKPLASVGFIGAAVAAGAFDTAYGNAIVLALLWSLIGDVMLIPRGAGPAFAFGLFAFLTAHIGFFVAFFVRGVDTGWLAAAAAGLLIPAYLVWRWLRPHLRDKMKLPVAAYIAVITTMVAGALATVGAAAAPLILVGAVAFYASDLTVARQRFVAQSYTNRLVGLPLYYAAQLLFAASVTPA